MIKLTQKWTYDGIEYNTKEEATLAAIKDKLGVPSDAVIDANIVNNATELVNLISMFSRKQVRAVA